MISSFRRKRQLVWKRSVYTDCCILQKCSWAWHIPAGDPSHPRLDWTIPLVFVAETVVRQVCWRRLMLLYSWCTFTIETIKGDDEFLCVLHVYRCISAIQQHNNVPAYLVLLTALIDGCPVSTDKKQSAARKEKVRAFHTFLFFTTSSLRWYWCPKLVAMVFGNLLWSLLCSSVLGCYHSGSPYKWVGGRKSYGGCCAWGSGMSAFLSWELGSHYLTPT